LPEENLDEHGGVQRDDDTEHPPQRVDLAV
jgi:hypothetical protein